jgi:phosphoglycerate kinase
MTITLPTLSDLEARFGTLTDKRVLVRCDFNVPVADEKIVDTFRIDQAIATLTWLRGRGALVRIISHISNVDTLALVVDALRERGIPARLVVEVTDLAGVAAADEAGDVVVFENVRRYPGEEANAPELAQQFAVHADAYVNEGFSVSHRSHASIVGIPTLLPAYAGLNLAAEVREISSLTEPARPYVAIVGGAKFSTKLPLIRRLLTIADHVCVVGALAHDIYIARGLSVGASPHSDGVDVSEIAANPKVWVPHDVIVTGASMETPGTPKVMGELFSDERILDAGAPAANELVELCSQAGTVVWNGPLGFYEKGFTVASNIVARGLVGIEGRVVIGGGDTLAVASTVGTLDGYDFVSTGGGAMLDLMSEGTMPGIEAILASK